MTNARRFVIHTHNRIDDTEGPVRRVIAAIRAAGGEVVVPEEEAQKHNLDGVTVVEDATNESVDVAVVLGGDGTMLAALRDYAGTGAPVFAFNYGAVGFLATMEPNDLDEGIRRLVDGDYNTLQLPTLGIDPPGGHEIAVNDIAFLRQTGSRVAELAYSVRGEEIGNARCDGLVVSTPVGSTGYNLANGGPLLAWGVEGYVVSYIAPHTLTNRTLVAATTDVLVVSNLSKDDPVGVETDGRKVSALEPGAAIEVRFEDRPALLAKVPGTGFYDQLRSKFGRLA